MALHVVFVAQQSNLLDLRARREVFQCVKTYPGLHLREIARNLGLDPNHAKYHLRTLERHGLVSSRRDNGYWRFWPKEEGTLGLRESLQAKDKAVIALLRRPVPLHVTLVLLDQEEASHGAILAQVGVSHSTLHYHLKKLEAAGMVSSRKEGRERIYRLVDGARLTSLLMDFRPPDSLVQGFLEAWESLEL